jgi:nitrous oxidase accessory protein NosD
MKMLRKVSIAALVLVFWFTAVRPVAAVDLATAFGVSGAPLPTPVFPGPGCRFTATHAGNTSIDQVSISANGSDSAVVTLSCNGVSVTAALPSIEVNGHQVNNVAFPQTVTSSAPGIWTVTVAGKIQFTVTAQ